MKENADMEDTQVWSVITIGIILIMFLGNKKVRVFSVFVEQLKVFKMQKQENTLFGTSCAF